MSSPDTTLRTTLVLGLRLRKRCVFSEVEMGYAWQILSVNLKSRDRVRVDPSLRVDPNK